MSSLYKLTEIIIITQPDSGFVQPGDFGARLTVSKEFLSIPLQLYNVLEIYNVSNVGEFISFMLLNPGVIASSLRWMYSEELDALDKLEALLS